MVRGALCEAVTDWEQYEVELFSCDFYFYGGGHGGGHGGGYGGGGGPDEFCATGGGGGGVFFCCSASFRVRIFRAASRLIDILSRCSGVSGTFCNDL